MGWDAVWQLALKQFGAEAVEIRIAIILAAALLALMVLIGLRHAFRPAGPTPVTQPAAEPRFALATVAPTATEPVAPTPFRVAKPALRPTRKRAKRTINRQRATRPSIRRATMEIDAPVPPRG